ncbi:sigma-54-dependent transcriptional regulator [Winogradskyella jejuensis]|uniref:DNA-binding transcriptional response regulator, NtrC family, contains REC, AAA-type ATPase, and a Fis-type DNA-binding domains n=1 Tax=Winogradskyella jejuensis TaxID=1089305 RepID=A0A1M5KKA6_9FLAO|nr:sigma-54 dependent transcriptional regulator [Winogradskyella jejuensis]SHG53168.1 DNA-binding transcriptional response regulator, NtrC family, contains REC, AAA-type ATPase, and a Fis-type DNA-binding domains [Winogradskyella jejuensis]
MVLKNASILVIDDDADVLTALRLLLKPLVKNVVTEKNPNNIIAQIEKTHYNIIILDMNFTAIVNTGNEGIFWLNKIQKLKPDTSVILMTAYADIDLAIRGLKEGASDFLMKPWKNEKIIETIKTILSQKTSNNKKQKTLNSNTVEIIGESDAMQDVFVKLKKVAPTDANVLILGENGTGKDLIARALHENSNRKDKPFIKVDVGALTSSLFESELFGYKKGAFTDAHEDREGRFEAANGGTLFLDEIGNITLGQQVRLLTVLQNRQVTPLGSNESIDIDIRLICATNVEPKTLADESKFRKDLIYRINTVDIIIPPLRRRGTDITELSRHFVSMYAEKYNKNPFTFDTGFISKLKKHDFPGNVRELQYVLERAVIMTDGNVLKTDDLVFSSIERSTTTKSIETTSLNLDDIEKNAILTVLEKHKGNVSKSAKELGITRAALYRRLEKYEL